MAARKTSTKPTRIWKFTARVTDEDAVREILMRANRYYNALVEIERARHARYAAIRREHAPELAALEDEWERLDDQVEATIRSVKSARQEHWQEQGGEKRRLLPAEAQAQIDALKAEQKRASTAAKEHRSAFSALLDPARAEYKRRTTERAAGAGPRIKAKVNAEVLEEMLGESEWSEAWKAIARSDDEAHKASLAARAECGLPTGTYLQVEEAFQRAKRDSLPRPPRFRRYSGNGKLAVQLRSATYANLISGTTALSISPAPHDPSKKGDQSRMMVVRLDQSVPRGERRAIEMTVKMHRRPPDDADVKWASLLVRRVGQRTLYELQLTLEHPSFAEPKRPAGTRPSEHVRIGWGRVDGGVRVASWASGEVVVPDSILSQHDHAAAIESAADKHFVHAKALLRRWMRGGPHRLTAWHRMLSDRSRVQLRHVCIAYADWALGEERRRALWREWRAERLARGEDFYVRPWLLRRWLSRQGVEDQDAIVGFWAYLWARKDEHLCQYAVDSRRRFVNRRDAFYRGEAIRIATEFDRVTVDSYKISALKELPSLTMPGDGVRDQAQSQAQSAAPGRFREILLEVMGPRCTPVERSSGEKKTGTARKRKGASVRGDATAMSDSTVAAAE